MIQQIIIYIRFRLVSGHRNAKGIHPPFAYDFISGAIFGKDVGGMQELQNLRKELLKSRDRIEVLDPGAGSLRFASAGQNDQPGYRRIRDLVRHTAVKPSKGRLLSRIAAWLDLPVIIELGTGTGFSSLYLATGSPGSVVQTCEGSASIAELAGGTIARAGAGNIVSHHGLFRDWLPEILEKSGENILVFIDGDHRGERLMEYCGMIIRSSQARKVILIDDIHWSPDMYRSWRQLIAWEGISLSLELYNLGILFIGYPVQRDHFKISFWK